ncbi:MAG TPA: saccharopine dehydrogenase NADP-binding domain-containing protein [Nevskiaceae bacterium]|nr:saccharopine dehydrogenase NADP-binding domain-containing protein [Nevskiaceae bacterium]
MATQRAYDIVLFGATGFTGALTAEYLARHAPKTLKWALAGRNAEKLKLVRARLADINPACRELPLLSADTGDAASIKNVAEAARVVITTVGPYLNYGEPLVAACAAAGTDYVDLTGEPEFVDLMWLRYHEQAQKSGARIVNCCGFDSIPHDLGARYTVRQLPEGVPLSVEGYVRAGGTFSGGTLHSAVTAMSRLREYARVAKERRAREKYPDNRKIGSTRQRIRYVKAIGAWAVPFPTIDPQVVRRSAAADHRYGPEFRYGHYVQVKKLPRAAMLVAGMGALAAASQLKFTRDKLLAMKAPGEGPSEEQRARSYFRVRFIGEGGGRRVVTEVSGGDPGYGETSKMLAESALSLAFDARSSGGGVITPSQAMGDALTARLQAAGIQFRVIES